MCKRGLTNKGVAAEQLGLSREQIKGFIKRRNKKKHILEAGKAARKKGRPCKSDNGIPPSIQRLDKLEQTRYIKQG